MCTVEGARTSWELDLLTAVRALLGMPHAIYLGAGLHELCVRVGQQPRLYFQIDAEGRITMLAYGRKDTQDRDIARARGRMT